MLTIAQSAPRNLVDLRLRQRKRTIAQTRQNIDIICHGRAIEPSFKLRGSAARHRTLYAGI